MEEKVFLGDKAAYSAKACRLISSSFLLLQKKIPETLISGILNGIELEMRAGSALAELRSPTGSLQAVLEVRQDAVFP